MSVIISGHADINNYTGGTAVKSYENISFKKLEEHDLYMDIYVPEGAGTPPIIMWIHGGGWHELNRTWNLMTPMLERGYAVATIEYRYADEGVFPTQMFDIKDALLYLREHGAEYGYDGGNIIVSGDSSGAHLACMLGVSVGNRAWEKEGKDYSVQAVVDLCAPTHIAAGFHPEDGPSQEAVEISDILGAPFGTKEALPRAAAADPTTYIDGTEPPFLIIQGSTDPLVSPEHSRYLRNALEKAGDKVHMYLIPGGVHAFASSLVYDIVKEFLDYYIKGVKTIEEPPVLQCHMRILPVKKK